MKMLIGGNRCDASDGKTMDVLNPATGEVVDTVPVATKADIEEVIALSVKGHKEWDATPLYQRMAIVQKFVDLAMEEDTRREIATIYCKEMGRPYKECYGDFNILKNHVEGFISAARNDLTGLTLPIGGEAGKEHDFDFTIRQSLGPIVCIIPFNAPFTLFAKKVAPALLTGNSVIVKPASDDPLALLRLGELVLEAGVPGNAFQMVTGRGEQIGDWLTGDKRIEGVSFTGSTEAGARVAENAGRNLKFQVLELGGNAPLIVCEDCDVDYAVAEAVAGRATFLTGQICTVAKRFLIQRSIHDAFVAKLVEKVSKIKLGDPFDPETQMGTLISEKAARRVEEQVNRIVEQGGQIVFGGKRNGAYYGPTVVDGVTRDMDVAHDVEIFGPVFPIITFDTLEEAIEIANDSKYGLGSGIITNDMKKAMKAGIELRAGNVVVNGQTFYRNLQTAFGGYKDSGVGREGQTVSLLNMTQIKNIVFKNIL